MRPLSFAECEVRATLTVVKAGFRSGDSDSLRGNPNRPAVPALINTWWLFLTIQLAAVVRMLPDLFPGWVDYRVASLAGLICLLTFVSWAAKYSPIYWRPRADGKPG
jgi:uncharacterized protein involved in response to NO